MKNVMIFVLLLIVPFVFNAQPSKPEPTEIGPKIVFDLETIDYGIIRKGADPLRKFSFKNTGNEPLLITSAKGSCGCTVPTYPQEAIAPGATAEIEVRYDTKRIGLINKTVTINSNAGDPIVLYIKGEVKE
jgi:Protein of unknown function (DUF1573)